MAYVDFLNKQKTIEFVHCSIDIPDDIISEGKEAIENYILENSDEVEFGWLEESYIEESFLDIDLK